MNVAVRPQESYQCWRGHSVASDNRSSADDHASGDAFTFISLCTGGGGLDLGLELAIPAARPVLLVEREAFAVAHLVAAMQAGFLADAPVWPDVRTLNGRPWRGLVDGLIGGIPCQPHSQAGKRQGSADERDLWSPTRRIIAQARPWFVLIENVAGMLTAGRGGRAEGPEQKGHVEVPGAQRVIGDLCRFGYAVEAGLFTAEEVDAPHERKRVFILALAQWLGQPLGGGYDGHDGRRAGPEPADRHRPMGNAQNPDGRGQLETRSTRRGRAGPAGTSENLPNPTGLQRQSVERAEPDGDDAGSGGYRGVPIFPPGPSEREQWASIAASQPHLEPAVCRMADGMAAGLDINRLADVCLQQRTDRLRMLGNGVVPLEAAHAIRTLLTAHHAAGTLETDRFVWLTHTPSSGRSAGTERDGTERMEAAE